MPVEKREPLGMSRDRANPVCFPGVSCLMRVWGLSNAMTCHSRSPLTVATTFAQLARAARDSEFLVSAMPNSMAGAACPGR